jgi:hypothetical protein
MADVKKLRPGQRVVVIDPEDGYYLAEGEVEEVRGGTVYVAFAPDDTGQRFRPAQLRAGPDVPGASVNPEGEP